MPLYALKQFGFSYPDTLSGSKEFILNRGSEQEEKQFESIKSLSEKPESETLIPIGIGTYVPTKILSTSKIVLSIGAGVAVEKDFPSAINYLEAHIKEIEVALQDNTAKKQDAAARLEQGREQINQLMQSVSQSKSG